MTLGIGAAALRRTVVRIALAGFVVGTPALVATCERAGTGQSAAAAAAAPASGPAATSGAADDVVLPEGARGITTAPARSVQLPDYLDITARIQADPTGVVRVYAPVSGRLLSVDVRPADYVQEGQVLATLASADLAQAGAAYRQAQADAQVKQQALERSRLLYENHVIALRDYQQTQADAQSATAALASARTRLELLGADPDRPADRISIRAPRSGVVIDVSAAPGEFAKSLDNSNPLCTIADLSVVWAVGDVYEKDLASIHVGAPAAVTATAYPDETRHGSVTAIGSALDTTTRTLKVRVVLANPGRRLKPDMFATIRAVRTVRTAVVVPETAVLREGSSAFVYVQRVPGHFVRHAVTLGRDADHHQLEVTSGLTAGDTVVVDGAELLRAAAGPS
jgi:cobalt-zinc-cadmium efflux system membrane fusion protein